MSNSRLLNLGRKLGGAKTLGVSIPKFTVNLLTTPEGGFEVRSCEVVGSGFRNRTSFQQSASIDEVFVADVAAGLGQCLARLSLEKEVVSLPEFKIQAPGLALGGAHILVSEEQDEIISIMIRFKVFLGNIDAVLCDNLRPYPCAPALLDKLASEVLFDITLPLLNICSASELGQLSDTERLAKFLDNLAESTEDLKFRGALLKRYIEDLAEGRQASAPHLARQVPEIGRDNALEQRKLSASGVKCV